MYLHHFLYLSRVSSCICLYLAFFLSSFSLYLLAYLFLSLFLSFYSLCTIYFFLMWSFTFLTLPLSLFLHLSAAASAPIAYSALPSPTFSLFLFLFTSPSSPSIFPSYKPSISSQTWGCINHTKQTHSGYTNCIFLLLLDQELDSQDLESSSSNNNVAVTMHPSTPYQPLPSHSSLWPRG